MDDCVILWAWSVVIFYEMIGLVENVWSVLL